MKGWTDSIQNLIFSKIVQEQQKDKKLCGILSYCAKIIKGAHTFSHRVIDLLKGLLDGNPRIRLSTIFHEDLLWWRQFAEYFNGQTYVTVIVSNTGDGPTFYTDSSMSGFGVIHDHDWILGFYNAIDTHLFSCSTCVDYHWIYDFKNSNIFPICLMKKIRNAQASF